ncbi:MAG: hypothetical protein WB973_20385 [Thermoanaerobaculia bacterium]
MAISENAKWVIFEVAEEVAAIDGKPTLFVSPETLKLEHGFVGDIVWFVFTPGWELTAVEFPPESGFDGAPQPDPDRPGCFSTAAANITAGEFHYSVTVQDLQGNSIDRFDPVVENEPPPSIGDAVRVAVLAAVS